MLFSVNDRFIRVYESNELRELLNEVHDAEEAKKKVEVDIYFPTMNGDYQMNVTHIKYSSNTSVCGYAHVAWTADFLLRKGARFYTGPTPGTKTYYWDANQNILIVRLPTSVQICLTPKQGVQFIDCAITRPHEVLAVAKESMVVALLNHWWS